MPIENWLQLRTSSELALKSSTIAILVFLNYSWIEDIDRIFT